MLRFAGRWILDVPNERSSHAVPTPRGGGISIILGVGTGLLIGGLADDQVPAAFVIALVLGGIRFVDDVRGIGVSVRLVAQVLVGVTGLVWLVDTLPNPTWIGAIVAVIAAIWSVGYTNAFNFMDGINGISAAQLIVAGATWVIVGTLRDLDTVTTLGAVTTGAALGFVPWNFPRARFFMGDVGSYFSGGWLAAVSIVGIQLGVPALVMVAPLLVYGIDTATTLVGRVARGEPWHAAHRDHVYQRLVVGGWSHAEATGFYAAVAGAVAGSGLLWLSDSTGLGVVGLVLIAVALASYLASPALFTNRRADPK